MSTESAETYIKLYRCLVVQGLLQRARKSAEDKGTKGMHQRNRVMKLPKMARNKWHVFLDSLSMLCDFKPGGETVSSIGVEDASPGAVFWITVNARTNNGTTSPRAASHLTYTIQALQEIAKSAGKYDQLETEIFSSSVNLGKNKVANYRRKVLTLLTILREQGPTLSRDGKSLLY